MVFDFRRILRGEVMFPKSFSAAAVSLIRHLLTRDPVKRLGFRGADQVKRHAFFKVCPWFLSFSFICYPRVTKLYIGAFLLLNSASGSSHSKMAEITLEVLKTNLLYEKSARSQ